LIELRKRLAKVDHAQPGRAIQYAQRSANFQLQRFSSVAAFGFIDQNRLYAAIQGQLNYSRCMH
jgi:hypothetical protein